jgi:hypothetical protein
MRAMFLFRALAVWLVIMCIEFIHGVLRAMYLAPLVGDFQARQISVLLGLLLILTIAYLFVLWIRVETTRSRIVVGLVWLVLTLSFELSFGRFVAGLSWERIASDYDVRHGGLLPFGLIVLTLSPLIAAKVRGFENETMTR